ncbi:MAG: response regulator transcription factor [Acidimicrobiia bacterium]|jgi:DNA-binding response OmpR family regulator
MAPVSGGGASIVVVEDDPSIAALVAMYLRDAGFEVFSAGDAEAGQAAVRSQVPDLVVADIGLPGAMDGLELCRQLRATSRVPIILLTARGEEIDRVLGLELGADDYVTKPFSPRELVARVRAVLRRVNEPTGERPPVHRIGALEVDTGRREVRVDGTPVELTVREMNLLVYLAENRGLALSRRQLLDGAWGPDWYGDERTVDVHVRQLRKKLADALPLVTLFGTGYRLD